MDDNDASASQLYDSGFQDGAEEQSATSKRLIATERQSSSSLESLPSELRSKVISFMPDLPTLRSLIHASPALHAQYIYNRNSILRTCLDRELDGFLVDAYATLMSRVRVLGSPRTDDKITDFLTSYNGWLSGSAAMPSIKSIDPSAIRWLAAYHLSVCWPLARLYSKWALTNLRKASSSVCDQDRALSRSEDIRISRAIYRYDTYHHLFGRNESRRHGAFRHHEINELFFGLFDPWEAEAIGCIDLFVRQSYEDIFNKVQKDLHPRNPKFRLENGVYNPEGSVDLVAERDDYMEGTVSRGLKMLMRLLAIDDHETLVAKIERCITHEHNLDAPLSRSLSSVAQDDRRDMSTNFPNARDLAEQRRDLMSFVGDSVPPNDPPLGWVLLWGGKYANVYADMRPEPLGEWGYVMWDERRWVDMGAKELIVMQWKQNPELVEWLEKVYMWSPVASQSPT